LNTHRGHRPKDRKGGKMAKSSTYVPPKLLILFTSPYITTGYKGA